MVPFFFSNCLVASLVLVPLALAHLAAAEGRAGATGALDSASATLTKRKTYPVNKKKKIK